MKHNTQTQFSNCFDEIEKIAKLRVPIRQVHSRLHFSEWTSEHFELLNARIEKFENALVVS